MKLFIVTLLLIINLSSLVFAKEKAMLKNNPSMKMSNSPSSMSTPTAEKEVLYWVAPMNPNYKMDKPGKSPMGMNLVPVYAESEKKINTDTQNKNIDRAIVSLSPETIQTIGVRMKKAQMAYLGLLIRSYGEVTENIRLQSDISSRVSGWIKELKIKAEGDQVKKGDLLFKLDSPELISAQKDYISAIRTKVEWRINAAKARLGSLGVQDVVIEKMGAQSKALSYTPFYATQDGIVSKINIREGSYVKPGMTVIRIQNYSSVWIDASVAEKDISYINKTTKASVSFPNLGIKTQQAEIDYIYPTLDRKTRTGSVRLVLDNPDRMIKPGTYTDIEFESEVKQRLSIPSNSILKSKTGDFIVIGLKEGRFQPRKILLGLHYKDRTEVLEGVNADDNIVISGQFLIDSESSLLESFEKMKRMHIPLQKIKVSDIQANAIDQIINTTLHIHQELEDRRLPNLKIITPTLKSTQNLLLEFHGTLLQFILEDIEQILIKSKDNLTASQWETTLNNLIVALTPWTTEGRSKQSVQMNNMSGELNAKQ
jgi:membrane fusion protein, copper/silver efflux system